MKRVIIGLAIIAIVFGAVAYFNKPASAFSIFGFKISFSSSQSSATTDNNGKTTTTHSSASYSYDSSKDTRSNPCHNFKNQDYTICSVYISNATADLLPYYEFVHSDEPFMQQFATAQLNSDFGGQAQKTITSRTIDWPGGDMDVTAPKIEIRSISLDQDSGTATLQTKETWNVKTDSGQTLINENDAKHMITMQNYANNGLLGQWTVSEIH